MDELTQFVTGANAQGAAASNGGKYGHLITPELLDSLRAVESSDNPYVVNKTSGAMGHYQFMPDTVAQLHKQGYEFNPFKPDEARAAAEHLLTQNLERSGGDLDKALAMYGGFVTKDPSKYIADVKNGAAKRAAQNAPINDELLSFVLEGEPTKQVDAAPQGNVVTSSDGPVTVRYTADAAPAPETPSVEPVNPQSATEQFIAGAKKSVTDLGTGAKQILDIPAVMLEDALSSTSVGKKIAEYGQKLGLPSARDSSLETQFQAEKDRRASEELMKSAPGIAGYIAGNIGTTLLGGTLLKGVGLLGAGEALINPTTYKAAIGAGAAIGALSPTVEGESRALNAAAGGVAGAAGLGLVNGLGHIAQPIQTELNAIGKKAAQTLRDAGIPLDAAQATGSTFLARVKSLLSDNPMTAGGQQTFAAGQKEAFNRAVAKTMGEDATEITPAVIDAAKNRIGKVYDSVAGKIGIRVDNKFLTSISDLAQEAKTVLGEGQYSRIEQGIANIFEKATAGAGRISGEQYQVIKRSLSRLASSEDRDVASFARELRDLLHEGLTDTASATGNQKFVSMLKDANRQWGNMRMIENVALKDPEGNVNPASLYNSLTTKANRRAFYGEDQKLADLASAGKMILPDRLPNSGTTARLLNVAVPAAAGAAINGFANGDVESAAKGAVAGIVTPKLAQMLMHNPSVVEYLKNGIGPGLVGTPLRAMLEAPKRLGLQKLPPAGLSAYTQSLEQRR